MFNQNIISNIKNAKQVSVDSFDNAFPAPSQLQQHYTVHQTWLNKETIQSYLTDHLKTFAILNGFLQPEPKNVAIEIKRLEVMIEDLTLNNEASKFALNEEGLQIYEFLSDNILALKLLLQKKKEEQLLWEAYQNKKSQNKYKLVFTDFNDLQQS